MKERKQDKTKNKYIKRNKQNIEGAFVTKALLVKA